ncbi:hypothetical protein EDD15DRAFT_2464484 [Pisolithus albus]|nr:hypothetical protein EDD15DRAFT_2464484 [Pisolithus albus]
MPLDINGLASLSITPENEKDLGSLMGRVYHQRLFVIDFQVRHLDKKSLTGLGQWLLRRWSHCQEKKATASKGLRRCGVDIPTLQTEWDAQVSAQTKPVPRHSSKAAENVILQIMETQKSLENYEARLEVLEKDLLHGVADMTDLNIQIAECHKKIMCFKQALQRQKTVLGMNGYANLAKIQNSAYLQVGAIFFECMHCQSRNASEIVCVNESLSWRDWSVHIGTQTKTAPGIVKLASSYNNLCLQMIGLIHKGKAPRGSIAPLLIPRDSLFKLDVDDDIWQDVGLGDDSDGIRSLLELRRCEEEERRLLQEKKNLVLWFSEEWRSIQRIRGGADDDLAYELDCRASTLAGLCLMWQKQLRDYPWTPDEEWGPSDQELHSIVQVPHFMCVDGDAGERLDGIESEGEVEDDRVLDDELLYVVEEFALADEYHQQSDGPMGEFSWGDEWDNNLLDMDPPSSPSKRVCR